MISVSSMKAFLSLVMYMMINSQAIEGQPVEQVQLHRVSAKIASICPSNHEMLEITNQFHRNISGHLFCGGGSDWRRVGYLDVTDPSQSCPDGLSLNSSSRLCGKSALNVSCSSTFYESGGEYSRVCGRVRGYQLRATDAFYKASVGIDDHYVDGVSLTHGPRGNRTHVWTFAASFGEIYSGSALLCFCQCVTTQAPSPPLFVGNDYFCESGLNSQHVPGRSTFYLDDPLWDSQNCVSSCCRFNHPPYFTKTLLAPTSDDIELRICSNPEQLASTPLDQVEIYVQ